MEEFTVNFVAKKCRIRHFFLAEAKVRLWIACDISNALGRPNKHKLVKFADFELWGDKIMLESSYSPRLYSMLTDAGLFRMLYSATGEQADFIRRSVFEKMYPHLFSARPSEETNEETNDDAVKDLRKELESASLSTP